MGVAEPRRSEPHRSEPWRAWGLSLARVERPATAEEVGSLLLACAEQGRPVVPVGAGRALAAAGFPGRAEVALCLDGLAGIVAYAPDDLTITARAGTRLAEIAAALAERGQWLPGAPADEGTVGGLVACAFTAALEREPYGLVRERVLGTQVAGADGKLTRSGGRVVKNVTGYGLHRMHAGAGGALGVITEICLRLESRPECREEAAVRCAGLAAAEEAWRWLRREGPDPAGLELQVAGEREAVLLAVFLGDLEPTREAARGVRQAWERWGRVPRTEGGEPSTVAAAGTPGAALQVRLLTSPSRTFAAHASVLAGARERGIEAAVRSHPNAGEVLVAASADASALTALWEHLAVRARAGEWHYRVEDEPPGLGGGVPAWSAEAPALRRLSQIKAALDPRGVLRPGSYSVDRLEAAAAYFERSAAEAAP